MRFCMCHEWTWRHDVMQKMPDTKGQIWWLHSHEVLRTGKFIETQSRTEVSSGDWGVGRKRSYCLMGGFCLLRRQWWRLDHTLKCTYCHLTTYLKIVKMVNCMFCAFYHSCSLTKCHNLCISILEKELLWITFPNEEAGLFLWETRESFWWTSKYMLLASIQLKIVNIPNNTLYIITVLYYNRVPWGVPEVQRTIK